mgnify:FL=1
MATCNISGKEYDPETVTIPNPCPDNVCGICGNTLSVSQINTEKERMEAVLKEAEEEALKQQ